MITWTKGESKYKGDCYATLLSVEELEEYIDLIPDTIPSDYNIHQPVCWYLRDTEEDGKVALAEGHYVGEPDEPGWYDDGDFFLAYEGDDDMYGTGNRPVLVFSEPVAGTKPGDKLEIKRGEEWALHSQGWIFTMLTDRLALCDQYISGKIFDENTNIYADSEIKKRIDEWFEKEIRPYL